MNPYGDLFMVSKCWCAFPVGAPMILGLPKFPGLWGGKDPASQNYMVELNYVGNRFYPLRRWSLITPNWEQTHSAEAAEHQIFAFKKLGYPWL